MASNLLVSNRIWAQLLSKNFENGFNGLICKRFVQKSPAQSQKGKKRPPKNMKLLIIPGQRVDERTILGRQKTLKYHPGFNVALDPKDKSLYSLCSGTVFYSIEKFNANPKSGFVQQFYSQQIGPVYKKYIHVIKDNNSNEFKLIDII